MRGTIIFFSAVSLFAATDGRLVDAVKNHDKDTVRALLKEHVDVNTPEADGTSALHWAAHSNDVETVQLFADEVIPAIRPPA